MSEIDDWVRVPTESNSTNDKQEIDDWVRVPTHEDSNILGALEAGAHHFGQGATLGFSDEIQAAVRALPSLLEKDGDYSQNYDKLLEDYRNTLKKQKEEYPGVSTTSELLGGVATAFVPGANIAKGVLKFLPAAKGILPAAARAIIPSAIEGAALGGAAEVGYSEDKNISDAISGAGSGMLFGGAIGGASAAGGALAKGIGKVGVEGGDWLADRFKAAERFRTAKQLKEQGFDITGPKAVEAIKNEFESNLNSLTKALQEGIEGPSRQIGEALNDANAGKISTKEVLDILDNEIASGSIIDSNVVGRVNKLKESLSNYYEIQKIPDVESAMNTAKKWQTSQTDMYADQFSNMTAPEPKISASGRNIVADLEIPQSPKITKKVLQQEVPLVVPKTPPMSPEDMLLKQVGKAELTAQGLGKEFDFSIPQSKQSLDGRTYVQTILENIEQLDPKELRKVFPILEKEAIKEVKKLDPTEAYKFYTKIRADADKIRGSTGGQNQLDILADSVLLKIEKELPQADKLKSARKEMARNIGEVEKLKSFDDLLGLLKRKDKAGFHEPVGEVLSRGKIEKELFSEDPLKRQAVAELENLLTGSKQHSTKIDQLAKRADLAGTVAQESNLGSLSTNPMSIIQSMVPKASLPAQAAEIWAGGIAPYANKLGDIAKITDPILRSTATEVFAQQQAISNQKARDLIDQYEQNPVQDQVSQPASAPSRGISSIDPIPHLEKSEGSALNAPASRVIKPGKAGIYDDGFGNPTAGPYGANLKSPTTKKVYHDLGIDPYNATLEQHEEAARYNWDLHKNDMYKVLNKNNTNIQNLPAQKQAPVEFLMSDIVYNGGESSIKGDTGKRLMEAIKNKDMNTFVRLYLNSNHYRTRQSRQPSLTEMLKKLTNNSVN